MNGKWFGATAVFGALVSVSAGTARAATDYTCLPRLANAPTIDGVIEATAAGDPADPNWAGAFVAPMVDDGAQTGKHARFYVGAVDDKEVYLGAVIDATPPSENATIMLGVSATRALGDEDNTTDDWKIVVRGISSADVGRAPVKSVLIAPGGTHVFWRDAATWNQPGPGTAFDDASWLMSKDPVRFAYALGRTSWSFEMRIHRAEPADPVPPPATPTEGPGAGQGVHFGVVPFKLFFAVTSDATFYPSTEQYHYPSGAKLAGPPGSPVDQATPVKTTWQKVNLSWLVGSCPPLTCGRCALGGGGAGDAARGCGAVLALAGAWIARRRARRERA